MRASVVGQNRTEPKEGGRTESTASEAHDTSFCSPVKMCTRQQEHKGESLSRLAHLYRMERSAYGPTTQPVPRCTSLVAVLPRGMMQPPSSPPLSLRLTGGTPYCVS